ncbi:VOC family protein [Reyranella sp. CPCC 100927]|uniref:VOC family protein n=1 Tax=Reyranella sp. CPCC 100927 TaxID=2599616 RepID=UPI0015B4594B|nr:VOC family protein [Reyranella sp. CPCC 100927]
MGLHHIDHYTIDTADIAATKAFYCDLLGLRDGERPPLPFPGVWLYCENGQPTVHIVEVTPNAARKTATTGLFNHVSFACTGAEDIRTRLERAKIAFNVVVLPGIGNTQFFMKDPNGISVELNFPATETRASDIIAMQSRGKENYGI